MATFDDLEQRMVARLKDNAMRQITGQQFLQVLQNLNPTEQARLLDAVRSGQRQTVGRGIVRAVENAARALAETRFNQIKTSGAVSADDLEDLL